VNKTTLIGVPLTSASPPLADQVRAAQTAGADLVELRVDCIGDIAAVEALLKGPRTLPFILTVRAPDEGGHWLDTDAERIALIERLGLLNPGYIDVEYATWQRSANIRQKIALVCEVNDAPPHAAQRAKNRLILSHHDLSGTPRDLDTLFDALAASPAEIVKLVFTPRDATDACRILSQLRRRAAGRKIIALALGEAGLITRVLARKFGAFLTFAALQAGSESAPGQPTIGELRGLYRWAHIHPETPVYGVVGWPVTHSQSPRVHNAALTAHEHAGVYLPLPVQPASADFAAFLDGITREPELGFAGLSVTLPHKEHALRLLRPASSEFARRCGAANTLTRTPSGAWRADNTDGTGALAALDVVQHTGPPGTRRRVAVLGAGGVARAIVAALNERGCEITIFNRTEQRAADLAREFGAACAPWDERGCRAADVLINCTSVGMWPAIDASPLPDDALHPDTLVFDTIYRPAETRLLRTARARGCPVVSGVDMFRHQAAAQYALWHDGATALQVMSDVLAAASAENPGMPQG
jgi:3-dehydroquinate dehydratase / shikimate dehydrogenase